FRLVRTPAPPPTAALLAGRMHRGSPFDRGPYRAAGSGVVAVAAAAELLHRRPVRILARPLLLLLTAARAGPVGGPPQGLTHLLLALLQLLQRGALLLGLALRRPLLLRLGQLLRELLRQCHGERRAHGHRFRAAPHHGAADHLARDGGQLTVIAHRPGGPDRHAA